MMAETLSIQKIQARYDGEWLLIGDPEVDVSVNVQCGEVLGHAPLPQGGVPMKTRSINPQKTQGVSRRELLKAGLAAGSALSTWPLYGPQSLWGGAAGPPKGGGILRVWGYDPPHFDPHLTINGKT